MHMLTRVIFVSDIHRLMARAHRPRLGRPPPTAQRQAWRRYVIALSLGRSAVALDRSSPVRERTVLGALCRISA